MTYTTEQLEKFANNLDEAIFRLTGQSTPCLEATAFRAIAAELIAARRKLEALKEAIGQAIDANQTELNLGNYDHDDVCKLQEEAIDVWQILTAAWEAAP